MIFVFLLSFSVFLWISCDDNNNSTNSDNNNAPVIDSITSNPDTFYAYNSTTIIVYAEDPDGDNLSYNWEAHSTGSWLTAVTGGANTMEFSNCCEVNESKSGVVLAIVSDGNGGETRDSITVWVLPTGK